MDYQPMNQTPGQTDQPAGPAVEQTSSNALWYAIGAVAIVVALGLTYFFWTKAPATDIQTSAIEQTQLAQPTGGDTTADISVDLNQIPDSSAALDQDAAAAAQAISGF